MAWLGAHSGGASSYLKVHFWPLCISVPGGDASIDVPASIVGFAGGKPVKDCFIDICETKSQCWLTEFILPD